ncbi:MAG: hypothetical protein LBM06_03015 [Prevotellaceae bacterium]|jgi:hypothetical protein|nr:hypothetical protein [Prevotellaceae bacterium]
MKRANRLYGLLGFSLLLLVPAACSKQMDETDPEANNETGNYELITLSTVANQGRSEEEDDPASRTVYAENGMGMTVTWNAANPASEVLQVMSYPTGVVEASGTNRLYGQPGTLSNNQKSLKFSGDGIIKSADDKYHYLYPVPAASQVTKSGGNVVVSYDFSQQRQQLGSTEHLAASDVMYTSARILERQGFTFNRACAMLRLIAKLPANTPAISRLTLEMSSAVLYTGLQLTYATDGSVSVKGSNASKSVSVDIIGDQTSTSERTVTAYLLVSAKDASGNNAAIGNQQMQLVALSGGNTRYIAELNTTSSSQQLEPGKRFTFAPNDVLVQRVNINLSQNGTANSYIVNHANGDYSFDATKRGNGVQPTSSEYTSSKPSGFSGTISSGNYTAKILWSMGGSSSASINGVISNPVYENGKITFATTNTSNNGNAVIALMSGDEIIWSWHIWKVDYDPYSTSSTNAPKYGTHEYPINGYYNNKVVMMKYNLGAVHTKESWDDGDNGFDFGLLYQWGRKDPFLGGVGTSNTDPTDGAHFTSSGTPAFNYNAGSNGTIALAISNPMSYYAGPAGQPNMSDWHSARRIQDLWGNGNWSGTNYLNKNYGTKTCFDPCPPSYKVAPHGTWTRYFGTEEATSDESKTPNVSGGFRKGYLFKYDNVNTTFYAVFGYRSVGGAPSGNNFYGEIWSSSRSQDYSGDSKGGKFQYYSGSLQALMPDVRASGFGVRCAKEN